MGEWAEVRCSLGRAQFQTLVPVLIAVAVAAPEKGTVIEVESLVCRSVRTADW